MGAYGGRADPIRQMAPEGPVYQAGTLSGNPLAVAAGLATLRVLAEEPGIYEHLESFGRMFDVGFGDLARRLGIALRWNRVGAMGSLFFSQQPVMDWPTASGLVPLALHRALPRPARRGIHLPPSPFEAWFWSRPHTAADIERTLGTVEAVLRAPGFPPWLRPRRSSSGPAAARRWTPRSSSRTS